MNALEDNSRQRLRQHFAQRVIHKSRQLLELWLQLQHGEWNAHELHALSEASERLQRCAERFEQPEHQALAERIQACLAQVQANQGRLNSSLIGELHTCMQRLSRTGLRHGDPLEPTLLPLRRPVYLALADAEHAHTLVRQMEFFGVTALSLETPEAFAAAMLERHPCAIVMDVDFGGAGQGLALVRQIQQSLEQRLPVLFFALDETDTPTRLAAVQAGGREFFTGRLDASSLLEKIDELTRHAQQDPFRVLVVDDSRTQATHTERVLNSAGILTHTLTDPIQAMDALAEFDPDLIILDMYMPQCTGTELARVIRQHERYVGVPIIYLSAEDDPDKQLDAMGEGGDDFLTKPIQPRHLIATVRNRAARARSLKSRMVRDSLTGLFNHTHILQLLDNAALRSAREGTPLCFAMLDIDHFKAVNDGYGHPMGDRVIKGLALFLKQRLRKTDCIGRYGGEEFAVVLVDTDAEQAHQVLDEIRLRFAEIRYPAHPHDLSCTFSGGIVELQPQMDARQLKEQADRALYLAKHAGRNRIHVGVS